VILFITVLALIAWGLGFVIKTKYYGTATQ